MRSALYPRLMGIDFTMNETTVLERRHLARSIDTLV